MMNSELLIKGYRGGVLVTMPPLSCKTQRDLLIRRIQKQEHFFKGGRIAIDVGNSVWDGNQIESLLRDLSDEGVCLWAILSTAPETISVAKSFDIPTTIHRENKEIETAKEPPKPPETIWLEQDVVNDETLLIEAKLCLIGDVHKDATLQTNGSVLIWGKAAGNISAGLVPCSQNKIFVLIYEGATFQLNGKEVTLPKKLKTGSALTIVMDGNMPTLEIHKEKRFGI